MPGDHDPRPAADTFSEPICLRDLFAELLWPRLLRTGPLALNPARLGIAFFMVVTLAFAGGLLETATATNDSGGVVSDIAEVYAAAGERFGAGLVTLDAIAAGEGLADLFVTAPFQLAANRPITAPLLALIALLVISLGGGSIARMAAVDTAHAVRMTWSEGLKFGAAKWVSLIFVVLAPLLIIWVIALAMRIVGWVMLSIPILDLVAGLLFGIALIVAFIAVLIIVATAGGFSLLIPAVGVEGTDAFDGLQRAYAYVFGRPLRLLLYGALLIAQGVILFAIIGAIALGVVRFAKSGLGAWTSDHTRVALALEPAADGLEELRAERTALRQSMRDTEDETIRTQQRERLDELDAQIDELAPRSTTSGAAWLIDLWSAVPVTIAAAFGVSYFFCGSTLLYLCLRRLNDGQEVDEIWMPGMIPGTMAPVEPVENRTESGDPPAAESASADGQADNDSDGDGDGDGDGEQRD